MQCSYFDAGVCRSCTLMGTDYPAQVADKHAQCRELLDGYPDIHWNDPISSVESGFRNKAKMAVGGTVNSPTLGILDATKAGVDLRGCGIVQPGLRAAFPALSAFITRARLSPYDVAERRGELKYILVTEAVSGDIMLRFVLRSRESLSRIRKHLPSLQRELPQARVISANLQPVHKAIIEGEQEIMLTTETRLSMRTGGIDLKVGPNSFFQTNTAVAEELYAQARRWAAQVTPEAAWDLYCGVGGFALHIAESVSRVTGIEVSAAAIESAEEAARNADIANVRFVAADATQFVVDSHPADTPGLVVVNPPRRGIGSDLAHWLETSSVGTVIYSSCNATTLATDLAALPSLTPVQARVFDMFPQTRHYETMVLLERR